MVFSSLEDLAERVDDPELDVGADDILVLKNAGPTSPSGMPEAGYLPIPAKLGRCGVRDMRRISDARMSGTAFGTVVLHVTPDAASGGPLALVRTGHRIPVSVAQRRLYLLVAEAELAGRRAESFAIPDRGYARLYREEVLQADRGCALDFLRQTPTRRRGGSWAVELDPRDPRGRWRCVRSRGTLSCRSAETERRRAGIGAARRVDRRCLLTSELR